MKILGSYHNHTRYSKFRHGKNTVKEMCDAARMSGIQEFAITDHASGHLFGVQKRKISKLREVIDKCKKENEEMNLLMGLEFNLLGLDGRIDFDEDTAKLLDIRLLGFHKLGRCGLKNFFKFVLPNLFCSRKMIEKNTDAYIAAIKKYKIDLITHPQDYIKLNLKRLAEACVANNCYLEINNRHNKMTADEIKEILDTGVKFLLGTDAHSVANIINLSRVSGLVESGVVPRDRIANLDTLPNFAEKYTKE